MSGHAIECRCGDCDRAWARRYERRAAQRRRDGHPVLDLKARLSTQHDLVPPSVCDRLLRRARRP